VHPASRPLAQTRAIDGTATRTKQRGSSMFARVVALRLELPLGSQVEIENVEPFLDIDIFIDIF
jgi:hypothetical protein